jgi:hypothetical protein
MGNEIFEKDNKLKIEAMPLFHPHRTPRCDRDHSNPRCHASTGLGKSPGKRQNDFM